MTMSEPDKYEKFEKAMMYADINRKESLTIRYHIWRINPMTEMAKCDRCGQGERMSYGAQHPWEACDAI
jgi:hypothetical protein